MSVAAAGTIPVFKFQDNFADAENKFAYPTTCYGYAIFGGNKAGTLYSIHFILGTGVPGTDYNNAPLGSVYFDIVNAKIYGKTAASTWTVVGSLT